MENKKYRKDEIKAGLYIFISAITLLLFILFISNHGNMGAKKTYYADFNFVNGIEKGAIVRFGGMKVGEVSKVAISPDDNTKIRIEFKVDNSIPVKKDSIVAINAIGIMGDYYIEVTPGSPTSEPAPNKSYLTALDTTRLDELYRNISEIASEVKDITNSISDKVENILDDNSRKHLKNIIAKGDELSNKLDNFVTSLNHITSKESQENIKKIISNIMDFSKNLKDKTNKTLSSIEHLTNHLDGIITSNENEISMTIKNMNKTIANLENITTEKREDVKIMLENLKKSSAYLEEVMRKNRGNINDTMHNIRVASENARSFTKKISLYPWTLIWRSKTQPEYKPKAGR